MLRLISILYKHLPNYDLDEPLFTTAYFGDIGIFYLNFNFWLYFLVFVLPPPQKKKNNICYNNPISLFSSKMMTPGASTPNVHTPPSQYLPGYLLGDVTPHGRTVSMIRKNRVDFNFFFFSHMKIQKIDVLLSFFK